jgi:hypothetical protein
MTSCKLHFQVRSNPLDKEAYQAVLQALKRPKTF